MNRLSLIVLAALLPAVFATQATAAEPKTRAQVLAELEQARADGSFWIDAGDGTPRGLARARLVERELRAQQEARALAQRREASRQGS